MFWWRKPKPDRDPDHDDEEPLVPHGLVWQATEPSVPIPQTPSSSSPADAIPVPSRENPDKRPVERSPAAFDSSPEPLPWASLNAQGAVRRDPEVNEESGLIELSSPRFQVTGMSAPVQQRSQTVAPAPSAAAPTSQNLDPSRPAAMKNFVARSASRFRTLGSEMNHAMAEVCAEVRHAWANHEFRKHLRETRKDAHLEIMRAAHAVSHYEVNTASLSGKMAGVFSGVRTTSSRARAKASRGLADSKALLAHAIAWRVKLRITTSPWATSFFAKIQNARERWIPALQRNSRLGSSMALAALAALLTLGSIVLLTRNQPSADAGVLAPAVSPEKVVATPPATAPKAETEEPPPADPSAIVNASARSPIQSPAPKISRKARHNPDEDYVAKDTYVYYGAKGKPSR